MIVGWHSIQLSASLFEHPQEQRQDDANNNQEEAIKQDNMVADVEDDGDDKDKDNEIVLDDEEEGGELKDENDPHRFPSISSGGKESLAFVVKKCYRLSSQVQAWEGRKYEGISPQEQAEMIVAHVTSRNGLLGAKQERWKSRICVRKIRWVHCTSSS